MKVTERSAAVLSTVVSIPLLRIAYLFAISRNIGLTISQIAAEDLLLSTTVAALVAALVAWLRPNPFYRALLIVAATATLGPILLLGKVAAFNSAMIRDFLATIAFPFASWSLIGLASALIVLVASRLAEPRAA